MHNLKTGRPRLLIFKGCNALINELLSIPEDPNNREDVDTKADDHAYDALRYGVMSRPRIDDPFMRMQTFKARSFVPFDSDFGY